jgi:hypothetical protein
VVPSRPVIGALFGTGRAHKARPISFGERVMGLWVIVALLGALWIIFAD